MHAMLQKNVDSGFITEEQGNYIEQAILNKETVIISGHASAGVRVFMATCMAIAKGQFKTKQVKGLDSIEGNEEFFLIPGQEGDFEAIVRKAFEVKGAGIVTLKQPEYPYAVKKIMKEALKATGDETKVATLLECRKIDGVPFMININKHYYENGKVKTEETPREF